MASAIRVVHLGLHGSIRALLRPGPRCVLPIYARAALGPMVRYILAGLTLHVHVWVRILGPRYLPRPAIRDPQDFVPYDTHSTDSVSDHRSVGAHITFNTAVT